MGTTFYFNFCNLTYKFAIALSNHNLLLNMGKRKITKFEEIENKVSKYVTYCKRKKGVIKKAMELSLLCGQDVMLAIYDKNKKKLVLYQST